jgi:hypothetical protein
MERAAASPERDPLCALGLPGTSLGIRRGVPSRRISLVRSEDAWRAQDRVLGFPSEERSDGMGISLLRSEAGCATTGS